MKAQGLPINFIVIAALAILILILAAGFVIAGSSTFGGGVAQESARTTCQGYCSTSQRSAADIFDTIGIDGFKLNDTTTQKYCTATFDIKGIGKNKTCTEIVGSCVVTFGDGSTYALTC